MVGNIGLKNIHLPFLMGFHMLLDFLRMVRDVSKLFPKNLKLMSSITLLIIFLDSILMVFLKICIKVLSTKAKSLQVNNTTTSAELTNILFTMTDYLRLYAGLAFIFICAFSFISLFFITASIIGSAVTYCRKDLSTKELLLRAVKSMKRTVVSWLYIRLLDLGYGLLVALLLLLLVLIFNITFTILAFSMILLVVALFFRTYLDVVWNLALVVSVLEDICGIEALGKAARLVKGSKLRGFFLNLFVAFSMSMFNGLVTIGTVAFPENARMIPSLFSYSITCLITMFLYMSYTVLYYECKKTHGEEVERKLSTEYTKVAFTESTPLLSADAP